MRIVIAIVLLAIGCWQLYAAVNESRTLKTHGSQSTSPFMLYALYFGYAIGVLALVVGIGLLFGLAFRS